MIAKPSRPPGWRIEVLLFLALLLTYAYFFQGGGWHQNSRFDLVRAIVEEGSIRIDSFRENTRDWAEVGDRTYCNKAPGLSFLASPIYGITRGLGFLPGKTPLGESVQLHVLVVFTVSILSAGLGVALLGFLRLWSPKSSAPPLLCVLAYSLGTLAFPWSTQFMAHQAGAALLFGGAALLFRERRRLWTGGGRPLLLAGLLLGVAGTVEETAIIVVPILLVYTAWVGGWRRAGAVCLGGLAPAILLAAYNTAAFGGPFTTARSFLDPRFLSPEPGRLFGALGLPDPRVMLELSFLPRRGIFYYSPVLLFAAVGLLWGTRRREVRPEVIASLAIVLGLFLFNSSFNGWHGGWSTGARYLVPAIPFLAVGLALVPSFLRPLAAVAGGISILLMTAVTAVNVSVPQDLRNAQAVGIREDVREPLRNYILPRAVAGEVSLHGQHVSEAYPSEKLTPTDRAWASYNLGECVGLEGLASLIPLLLLWGGFAAAATRRRP